MQLSLGKKRSVEKLGERSGGPPTVDYANIAAIEIAALAVKGWLAEARLSESCPEEDDDSDVEPYTSDDRNLVRQSFNSQRRR